MAYWRQLNKSFLGGVGPVGLLAGGVRAGGEGGQVQVQVQVQGQGQGQGQVRVVVEKSTKIDDFSTKFGENRSIFIETRSTSIKTCWYPVFPTSKSWKLYHFLKIFNQNSDWKCSKLWSGQNDVKFAPFEMIYTPFESISRDLSIQIIKTKTLKLILKSNLN